MTPFRIVKIEYVPEHFMTSYTTTHKRYVFGKTDSDSANYCMLCKAISVKTEQVEIDSALEEKFTFEVCRSCAVKLRKLIKGKPKIRRRK